MKVICQHIFHFKPKFVTKIKRSSISLKFDAVNKSIMLTSRMRSTFVNFNTFTPLGLN